MEFIDKNMQVLKQRILRMFKKCMITLICCIIHTYIQQLRMNACPNTFGDSK